jgi:hypothetical protein
MEDEEKSPQVQQAMPESKGYGDHEQYISDEHESDPISSADAIRLRKVYRKLDLRIIPAFWVLYFLCSAVRANVGCVTTDLLLKDTSLPRLIQDCSDNEYIGWP